MAFIFVILSILSIVVYFLINRREYFLNLKSLFLLFIVFMYLFIPMLDDLYFSRNIGVLYYIVIFCSIGSILFGYLVTSNFKLLPLKKQIYFSPNKENAFLIFILLISFLFLYLYANSFGGFIQALINGSVLRYSGGNADVQVSGSALALYFIAFAKIVGAVYFHKIINSSKSTLKEKKLLLLFVLASFIVLMYGLINASRGAIVLYLLMLIYVYMYNYFQKNRITVFKSIKLFFLFVFFVIFLLFFIFYGKKFIAHSGDIFEGVEYGFSTTKYEKTTEEKIDRFIKEFSHPYRSLNMQIEEDVKFTYFEHFILAPLHLIPVRILNEDTKLERITEYNTLKLTDMEEGGIPPGIFATFWYSGGFLVTVLSSFLYGVFISYIQKYLEKFVEYNTFLRPYVLYFYFTVPWHSFNGDPSIILKSNIYLILFIILLILATLKVKYRFYFNKANN